MGGASSIPGTLPKAPTQPPVWHPLSLEEHPIDQAPSLKVIVVGAGIAGINAAILLPAKVPGLELTIYEREADIGGVWHQCTYPGVRYDVPSHVFQSTYAPSKDWSEHYAQGAEVKAYWKQVAAKYEASRYIRCNHTVQDIKWDEAKSKWLVTVAFEKRQTVDEAHFVILATGVFSHPTLPNLPGLSDFEGQIIHSSRWDNKFEPAGKNIAIIGNGSSGMQLLPQLQKVAGRIDHYARSPTWVAGSFGGEKIDKEKKVPPEVQATFDDPEAYLAYRKEIENRSFSGYGNIMKDSDKVEAGRQRFTQIMKSRLGDRIDVLEAITPEFPPSCRRLTPGPGYLEALTQGNVEYITSPIQNVTKHGIETQDGKERRVDTIICCTGSEKSLAPPFSVRSGSVDLSTAWRPDGEIGFPNTYMGIAAPGFPNLLFINGPQASAATGTLPFATESQLTLAAKILRKARSQGIRSMAPTLQATEDFRAFCEAYFPRTVLSEECRSWFNGGQKGGRVIANWPGSGTHANMVRKDPRWEDWEYSYQSETGNRFAYFGNGWTVKDVEINQDPPDGRDRLREVDMTPYLNAASVTGDLDLRAYHEVWFEI
ncbi:hypothetical protein V2G26_009614 [Clonostachys chloroleuca]